MGTLPQSHKVHFDSFVVDLRAGEIYKHGIRLKLQDQPFRVFSFLLERPGQVVTREELRQRLWPADTFVDFDTGLNSAIKRLRDVLGDSADKPRYVETLPRRGYRFLGSPERCTEDRGCESVSLLQVEPAPETRHASGLVTDSAAPAKSARLHLRLLCASIFALAALGLAAFFAFTARGRSGDARVPIESVAVLPLQNLSADPSQEYFADGMTDELTTRLSNIGDLRVISRTSVMHYKGTQKTIPDIARELNVDAVLEGSVLRSGDKVRISSQLIQASTDKHLWAESYERDLRDVLALQDEVAGAIAEHVRGKLTSREHSSLASSRTVNPEAYEAYLQGEYFWNQITEEGIKKSVAYFEKAIQLAPDYAPAYASLAFSYNLLASSEFAPPTENYSKARQLARQALDRDETLPKAHAALGFVLCYSDWNWPAAEAEFKRAIDLTPGSNTGRGDYALYLADMGRSEEAIAQMKKTLESDPLSVLARWNLGWMYWASGKSDSAIEQFQKILEIAPNSPDGHQGLGMAYVFENRHREAVAELQKAVSLARDNVWFKAWLGYAYAAAGNRHAAYEVLNDLKQMSRRKYVSAYLVATVYAGLGDKNSAFIWLTTALEQRNDLLVGLKVDPVFASLRSDSRFADLLRRIGLSG